MNSSKRREAIVEERNEVFRSLPPPTNKSKTLKTTWLQVRDMSSTNKLTGHQLPRRPVCANGLLEEITRAITKSEYRHEALLSVDFVMYISRYRTRQSRTLSMKTYHSQSLTRYVN